ncbi:DUF5058 family protein [Facklamia sp. P13069]|uniref:DUF5058 family protein n=1 Tax=unclassified Facklamia TaxID=2622293 RepID=UPI003D1752FF
MRNNIFLNFSNGRVLFFLCLFSMLLVVGHICVFIRRAWKEAKNVGISKNDLKQMVINSILSAILPTLSSIIFLIMLTPILGRFFSWLRLSVIGSASYEYLAADIASKALNISGINSSDISLKNLITIMLAMSIGISSGPIVNILFFKPYYSKLQIAAQKKKSFKQYIGISLMMTMMTVLLVPRVLYFENRLAMATTIFSAILVYILELIGRNEKVRVLKDFSYPISILAGVVFAIVLGNTILV